MVHRSSRSFVENMAAFLVFFAVFSIAHAKWLIHNNVQRENINGAAGYQSYHNVHYQFLPSSTLSVCTLSIFDTFPMIHSQCYVPSEDNQFILLIVPYLKGDGNMNRSIECAKEHHENVNYCHPAPGNVYTVN